jgi:hypothetical protein
MDIEVEGITVPVIGLEDFFRNKREEGRLQDLASVKKFGEPVKSKASIINSGLYKT